MIVAFGIKACTNVAAFKKNVRAGMGKVAIVKLADEVMFLLAFSFLYRMNILTIEVGFNEFLLMPL